MVVEDPIVLSAVQDAAGSAMHWRVLVVLEEGSQAEVWEQYLSGAEDTDGLFTTVVELVVGQNANLRFVSGQALSEKSWIFGSQRAEVQRDATLDWVALGFGTERGKLFQETKLAGPGSTGKVTGAYATRGRQHVDFDTLQEHAAPGHGLRPGLPRRPRRPLERGLARDDPGRRGRAEDRRLPGEPQPPAVRQGPRRRDPRPGDRGQRRALHARRGDRPDRPRAALLPALPRASPTEQANRLVIEGFLSELVSRFEEGPVRDTLAAALEHRLAVVL